MKNGFMAILCAGALLFSAGCSKGNSQAPSQGKNPMPKTGDMPFGRMTMPMMKEDPRSIKSVEGIIQELNADEIVVFTTKNVLLKFKRDGKTSVLPVGTKLAAGMDVKIEIEHLPRGMRAKSVQFLPATPE